MEQQTLGIDRDFFISFFLPEGMIDWFEVVHMTEENNPGTTIADKLYNRILNIYLDERDNRSEDQMGLKPNGFTEPTVIKDYPIRNRKVLLHVRRRRYLAVCRQPAATTNVENRTAVANGEIEYLPLLRETICLNAGKPFRTVVSLVKIYVQLLLVKLITLVGWLLTIVHHVKVIGHTIGKKIYG